MSAAASSVATVVSRWFPDNEIHVSHAKTGASTPVFHVQVNDKPFWVRLGETSGERRDGEIAAHRSLFLSGVPVPEVIRYEAAPPDLDRSIALTSHMPGAPLADLQSNIALPSIAADAGRILARINGLPIHGYGWAYAQSGDGVPIGEHTSRSEWTRAYRDAAYALRMSGELKSAVANALENVIDHWAQIPDQSRGVLAHGDFDASHIYVDSDHQRLTGIIDFGELRGADSFYDLGHLLLHEGEADRPRLFPHILSGYAEVAPLPSNAMDMIQAQAIVIGARALALQLDRPTSQYRDWLVERLECLARMIEESSA